MRRNVIHLTDQTTNHPTIRPTDQPTNPSTYLYQPLRSRAMHNYALGVLGTPSVSCVLLSPLIRDDVFESADLRTSRSTSRNGNLNEPTKSEAWDLN
ncbi:hypothetical protein V1478_011725 [Vespula squamosa]|uniref:Uncharacterized protein n=1 Tax=Vespula squamosa TaxID=30214 RepID=A0ABD2AB73_VESSQ